MDFAMYMIVGTVVFTGIIVGLVAVLMVAKKWLVAEGNVNLFINKDPDKTLVVTPGQTLLSALGGQQVFIPSACGGGGSCGQCKVVVEEGGGDVLPTELPHLSMRERKSHVRLGCQVKVKSDMKLEIPEEIFGIKKFQCTVRSNDNVATFIKALILDIDSGEPMHFESGGYIQIDIPKYELTYKEYDIGPEYRAEWDKFDMWSVAARNDEEDFYRAYSMANYPAEGAIVMLNVRVATPPWDREINAFSKTIPAGRASSYIFNLKPGDKVTVSGPYGEFFINETEKEMVYIGGGAGMAPLRSHIYHLLRTLESGRRISYWYGARSLVETFYLDELHELEERFPNFTFHLALSDALPEDNWTGLTGFIHQVLHDEYLSKHEEPEECEYYICGPPMMFKAVRGMLSDLGVPDENVRFDDFG
ncbi:MAG: NADH:ubiquinone reductase (Na(+)-transporting) subunit F [Deltaproteobacteria bacterium]|nr:NADH:ubiquinone reductase (Na(+)-transporting) subunit F [Deltaproteobacteria bacterium]